MKKIVIALILLAMLTSLLASCKTNTQQTDGPPTEAEIAEFRSRHTIDEGRMPAASQAYPNPHIGTIAEYWEGEFDQVFVVEITGERETRVFDRNDAKTQVREVWNIYYYPGRVVELIAKDSHFRQDKILDVGDNVDIWIRRADNMEVLIGDRYFVAGYTSFGTQFRYNSVRINTFSDNLHYITDRSYIIDVVETSGITNHTGKSYTEFRNNLVSYFYSLKWYIPDVLLTSYIDDVAESKDAIMQYDESYIEVQEMEEINK